MALLLFLLVFILFPSLVQGEASFGFEIVDGIRAGDVYIVVFLFLYSVVDLLERIASPPKSYKDIIRLETQVAKLETSIAVLEYAVKTNASLDILEHLVKETTDEINKME